MVAPTNELYYPAVGTGVQRLPLANLPSSLCERCRHVRFYHKVTFVWARTVEDACPYNLDIDKAKIGGAPETNTETPPIFFYKINTASELCTG